MCTIGKGNVRGMKPWQAINSLPRHLPTNVSTLDWRSRDSDGSSQARIPVKIDKKVGGGYVSKQFSD